MKKSLNKIFLIFKIYFISYYLLSWYNLSLSKSLMTWLTVYILFSFSVPRKCHKNVISTDAFSHRLKWEHLSEIIYTYMQWKFYSEAK